ncbi:MAG: hypothetical protein ACJAYE_000726 [Candidatus Azotimanducaceae bacterium]|jgi:hypothetical protein
MFNPTSVVIDAFLDELIEHYINQFGDDNDDIQRIIISARNALEIIANSDAPYHDVNHTIMVTLVGTEILRGKNLVEGCVSSNDWVHFVISLLNHDIGYVRGICKSDRNGRFAINADETIAPPAGSTDAFLTPYHVDRAKLHISERFSHDESIDVDIICANIERTRFPVPSKEDHQASDDYPGLLRAADLIGQLADPQYMRKISALFQEFRETGQAAKMGYTTAADLRAGYPRFFWNVVSRFIGDGVRYLRRTQEGQVWVANLYANVFAEEHDAPAYGPERRLAGDRRDTENLFTSARELTDNNKRQKEGRRAEDTDVKID